MTAKHTQVGVLAVGLLAILIAIGCSSDSDVISSGNVVVNFPASLENPSGIDYDCIRLSFNFFKVKPADGVCSASAGDFAGRPCGSDLDCTNAIASCDEIFGLGCDDGPNFNLSCSSDENCPGGSCVPRGECATLGGMFTGQGCFNDLDCTPDSGEKCSGRCSAGSAFPNGPCIDTGDCTPGDCEGAQASDTLGGSDVTLINAGSVGIPVYFTDSCPSCDLESDARPILCSLDQATLRCVGGSNAGDSCTSDADCAAGGGTCEPRCRNRCLTQAELAALNPPVPCTVAKCCEKFELIAPPCQTTSDCEVNECVESSVQLSSAALPQGKYIISDLRVGNLLMYAIGVDPELVSCRTSGSLSGQFNPPVEFEVGPGRANQIRTILDLSALEELLGLPGQPGDEGCNNAFNNFEEWLLIEAD